jgi:hypothetical protein
MDNIITGAIGVLVFMAFVIGLAESIGALPFAVIVGVVCILLCIDFFQSAKAGLRQEKTPDSEHKPGSGHI